MSTRGRETARRFKELKAADPRNPTPTIRQPRSRLPDVIAQQRQAATFIGSTPLPRDLGGSRQMSALLTFTAAQRDVIRKELTPGQKKRLRDIGFSSTPIPLQRAPSELSGNPTLITAAASGGGLHQPSTAVARPRTILNLNWTGNLLSTARHEIAHQLSETSGDVQHEQISLIGGSAGSSGTAGSVSQSRKFFKAFERISSDVRKPPPRAGGGVPDPTMKATGLSSGQRHRDGTLVTARNVLKMNI